MKCDRFYVWRWPGTVASWNLWLRILRQTCFHHKRLRESYCSLFATQSGAVVDSHPDYLKGAGMTEHSLFVSGLQKKTGFVSPLAKGPQHGQRQKKVRKPKPKRFGPTRALRRNLQVRRKTWTGTLALSTRLLARPSSERRLRGLLALLYC